MAYTLDTARVNAKTIFCMAQDIDPKKYNSFKFGWDLAKMLITPHANKRSVIGLTKMIKLKQRIVLGKPLQPPAATIERDEAPPRKRRCHIHTEEAATKKEKDNAPKSTNICDDCKKVVCAAHSKRICTQCLEHYE